LRILIVNGDASTARSLELIFKSEDFNVYVTDVGEEGLELGKLYDHDIIVLDSNLPDMSIIEYISRLRASRVATPILVLSANIEIEEKVRCLGLGADDYMIHPFHRDELMSRVRAIVRRFRGHAGSVITIGDIDLDLEHNIVRVRGIPIHLTGKEFKILELLFLRKNFTLTKDAILDNLYGGMDEPELKIIDVFICKLRKKLVAAGSQTPISTVWGRGVMIRDRAIEALPYAS
jgi:two-component system, cell cycle response regulator CtrA